MRSTLFVLFLGMSFTAPTFAHPGEVHDKVKVARQMNERSVDAQEQIDSYSQCSDSTERRAMQERAYARRGERLAKLREERGIKDDGEWFSLDG